MGCADIWCFICGNNCSGSNDYELDEYDEKKKDILENKLSPKHSKFYIKYVEEMDELIKCNPNIRDDLIRLYKNTRWMINCTMLLKDDQVLHGFEEIDCWSTFKKDNKTILHFTDNGIIYQNGKPIYTNPVGLFIHTDCWNYIKDNYQIELKFSHLPPVEHHRNKKIFNINYGDIEEYWEQFFNFMNVVIDKKKYLCSSPLKNDKNISQIKKNINALKLKNNPNRKGPAVSATFYKNGNIRFGNNNNFWIIKSGKWVEIKEKIIEIKIDINLSKLNKKQYTFITSMPYIGEYNINPIFITFPDASTDFRYYTNFYFIMTESYKDIFTSIMGEKILIYPFYSLYV